MKKIIKVSLILLLIVNSIMIYFFDNNYDFFGIFDYEDFVAIFDILIAIILILATKNYKLPKNSFKGWIIFFMILCFLSSLQSHLLFEQSILDGIIVQKELISICILYFPLSKIIHNNLYEKEKLLKLLDTFAIIQLTLFITQYLLSSSVSFLTVHTAKRYGDIRYYFNPILLDFFLIRNLDNFLNKKGSKSKAIIFMALVLFEVMVVQKYRLTSIALIIVVVFGLIISKTNTIKKFGYLVTGTIFTTFMLNTRIVQDLISEVTIKNKTFTYSIRSVGRRLYLNMVKKHPLLGGGYPKTETALNAAGLNNNIIFSDNGIFGFMYIYGLVGIIWFITLWFKLLKNGYAILKKNNSVLYLLFPLFFVMTSINELHWYWQHGFIIFILFLVLFEKEMNQVK